MVELGIICKILKNICLIVTKHYIKRPNYILDAYWWRETSLKNSVIYLGEQPINSHGPITFSNRQLDIYNLRLASLLKQNFIEEKVSDNMN